MNKSESKYFNTALLMDEALLLLLEKKEYEFITIKEICEKAGVYRSTFYLHYETIDDLFLIDDKHIIPYLNFMKENKKIYKLIHKNPYIFKKQEAFETLYNELFSVILDKYGVPSNEQEYIFSFFSYGLVAIIQKWIENDCKDDVEMIAEIMKRVISHNSELR